jgi:hypothetical protein
VTKLQVCTAQNTGTEQLMVQRQWAKQNALNKNDSETDE